jgi:hypothetical protein
MCPTVSFWTKKLTEVTIPHFPKQQVLSVIQMKELEVKNKIFKSQVPIKCLIFLFFIFTYFISFKNNNTRNQNQTHLHGFWFNKKKVVNYINSCVRRSSHEIVLKRCIWIF